MTKAAPSHDDGADEFRELLLSGVGQDWSKERVDAAVHFRELVLHENESQNLTRIISPRDFYEGHVLDVVALHKSGFLDLPALDLGAGAGVPGLLYASIYGPDKGSGWSSCDSEKAKADFVGRAAAELGLSEFSSSSLRAEELLKTLEVKSIVSRAVGTASKLMGWLQGCSTWNNLILFKGPKWEEEWSEFQKTSMRRRLEVVGIYEYSVGEENKQRKIVKLRRVDIQTTVPRGTKK